MVGIGLGAFTSGLTRGLGIRRDQEEFELAKEDRLRRIAREEEDRKFELEQRERSRRLQSEMDQDQADRDAVASGARKKFEQEVASGNMSDDDFDRFWNDYTIPKLRMMMLEQNDYDGARALDEWSETEEAKRGAKLVGSSLLKAQTGDHAGALKDVIEVSKINGYLNSDYEITNAEPVEDDNGQTIGYRLTIDANGEDIEQDIALQDIPQVISTFANPAAAFQSQMEAQARDDQKREELDTYAKKKAIDAESKRGANDNKLRADALKSLTDEFDTRREEALNFGDGEEVAPNFYDLSRDDQEKLINQRISVMTGDQPTIVPNPKVIADTQVGKVVPVGIARPDEPDDVLPPRNDYFDDIGVDLPSMPDVDPEDYEKYKRRNN